MSYLNEEVNCTEPSPSVSILCFIFFVEEQPGRKEDRVAREEQRERKRERYIYGVFANVGGGRIASPWACTIKLFMTVFLSYRNKLECLRMSVTTILG
jgi:hypothetical protein